MTHFGEVPGVSGGALGRKGAAGQEWKEGEPRAGWQPARPAVAEGWDTAKGKVKFITDKGVLCVLKQQDPEPSE